MWRFDGVDRQDNNGLGSTHATDVPFIFNTIDDPALAPRIGANPSAAAAAAVHGAWVRFITDHEPGWTAYTAATRSTALIGTVTTVVDDPNGADRRAWLTD